MMQRVRNIAVMMADQSGMRFIGLTTSSSAIGAAGATAAGEGGRGHVGWVAVWSHGQWWAGKAGGSSGRDSRADRWSALLGVAVIDVSCVI
jgi:hypothetical protein